MRTKSASTARRAERGEYSRRTPLTNEKLETLIKASIVIIALGSTGCGLKLGDALVIGTTEFLETAQQSQASLEHYTPDERRALDDEVNK